MKIANMFVFGLLFLMAISVASAQYIPVGIENVELNDVTVYNDDYVRLDLERNEDLDVQLELLAYESADDVTVRAIMDGYEYSDVDSISALIGPFDLKANVTYIKKLTLHLPAELEVGNYKLRIIVSDKNSYAELEEYNLQINTPRHELRIDDVTFNPGRTLTSGQALLGTVRVENKGQKTEKDVRVAVSMPALGLESVNYIEKINDEDEEETEEFFLRLPRCAEPGVYDVNVDVYYNKGHDKVSGTTKVTVLENELCKEETEQAVVVVQPAQPVQPSAEQVAQASAPVKSTLRTVLEVILIVLVALLVVVGLVIVLTRLREE